MNIIRMIRKVLLVVPTLFIASVLLLGIPVGAAGSVIYVDAEISASGNGSSWDTAYKDLQSALNAAESGDQIWVAAETYNQGTTITLKDSVHIYGGFNGTETALSDRDYEKNKCILSGNDSYTVVSGTGLSNSAVLDGFIITGGSAASGEGGGLYNINGSPILANLTFTANSAESGGGLYNKGGSPTLTNLIFTENSAALGGGMYNENGSPTLSGVTFSGNDASDSGGGMYVLASDCPTLTGVIFDENSANNDGGGIMVSDSGISIINSIFINNTGNGGGIFFDNDVTHTQRITNATFTNNSEALRIANGSSTVDTYITNTIMWGDSTEIYLEKGNCYVSNSIIKGSGGSNSWNSSFGTDQGNNLDSDPLFTGTDDFTLQNGSPAIDSGTNSPYESGGYYYGVNEDLLGNQRIIDGTVDMGAYEMVAVGSIGGTVTTGTSPVEGASVTVAVGSVTLSATTGPDGTYTLKGVPEGSAYTVTAIDTDGNNASVTDVIVTSDATTTVNIAINKVISINEISGVTAPAAGVTPVSSITETGQYTGNVAWTPVDSPFEANTGYTATITLTPKAGYTLTGIDKDFFAVPGAVYVSNEADSGVITAVFPAKEAYTKYNINDGSVIIYTGGDYLIYGNGTATANTITVNKDVKANITLDNVNIDASTAGECAFYITNASDPSDITNIINLTLTGTNTLKSGGNYSGLHAYNGHLNFTSESTGSLTATGSGDGAGIGSDNGISCLCINIYGGTITAYGGSSGGAGIGSGCGGSCSTISISGGTVEAHGGTGTNTNYGGAGIGSGYGGSCFSIGISGGEVTAYGGSGGTGIGGSNCAGTGGTTSGSCSNIEISGGKVTATGCDSGAGIGGDNISVSVGTVTACGGSNGAGIWIGCYGAGSMVTINSGTVEATGNGAGAGIGGGLNNTAGGTVTINGGTVTANSSSAGAGIGGGELGGYNYTITISGGIVTATSSKGAGIGGGDGCSIGSVTINSGTVTAAGGYGSAGIGGGGYGGGGTITINGGVIKANGGTTGSYGPGIGAGDGGNGGTVTINGGFVTADGNGTAQDIGYGPGGSLDMTVITGGSVYAVSSKVDPAPMSAASGGVTEYLVTVTGLPESTEVTYYVGSGGSEIDTETDSNGNIYLWLPESTAETMLTISDAAKTYIASGTVSSSETNSFEAAEPDTRSSEKSITAFSVGVVSGTIDETSHTIAVTVPHGTDVTSLSPTITLSTGATVSPASGTAQDFTNPVTYTVTAENETTQAYTVTVTVTAAESAAINPDTGSFYLYSPTDVEVTITWNDAAEVTAVTSNGSSIGTDNYSVSVNTLTIKKEYLATQASGSLELTVQFDKGSSATLIIAVMDNTSPAISPTTCYYDLSAPADVTAAVTWNSAASVTDVVYSVSPDTTHYTLGTEDYTVSDNTLTIKNSFFSGISLTTGAALEFDITFNTGAASTLTVNVVNGYTPSDDAGLSSLSVNGTAVNGFDADDTEYDVELPCGATSATVTATASDANAQVSITQASSLPGSAVVTVTAEDGTTTRTYTVNLTIAAPVTTYTVTFNSNGAVYATKTVNAGQSIGSAAWPSDPTRSSYTFGGWFTGENGTGTQFTSATPVNNGVTVYAKWTYSGGGGGGSSSGGGSTTPATSSYTAEVSAGNAPSSTLPVTVDKSGGTASMDAGSGNSLMSEGKTTVIAVPSVPDVDTYTLGITVQSLSTQDEQGALAFSTATGTVTVPSNMLTGVPGISGSKAEISIGQGDKTSLPSDVKAAIGDRPLVQLTLSIDGKQTDWINPNTPVTVSIPYTPTAAELANPESIVIWYIDGSGNAVSVPNGHYDSATGTVTFTTTHFSYYAVGYNKVSFNDVADTAWYSDAVDFVAARGITSGTGNNKFSPDNKLTRGQFLVMVMRAYGIKAAVASNDNFADAGNTYYTGYLAAARELGITTGVGNNMFAPDKEITRQEMFNLLYKVLKVAGELPKGNSKNQLSSFSDANQVASWAKDAMTLLVETGTINGSSGKLAPANTTTRAEMAQVLYNLLWK